MAVKQFQQDEVIFRQGDEGSVFYQIVEGSVGIYSHFGMPDQVQLSTLAARYYDICEKICAFQNQ